MAVRFSDGFNQALANLICPEVVNGVKAILGTEGLTPYIALQTVETYLNNYRKAVGGSIWAPYPIYLSHIGNGIGHHVPNAPYYGSQYDADIGGAGYYYINTGDTYCCTVMYSERSEQYCITSLENIDESIKALNYSQFD